MGCREAGTGKRPDVEAGVGAGREGCGNVAGLVTRGSVIEAWPYWTGESRRRGGESGICC